MFYTYVYLDPRKPGIYEFGDLSFGFEPIYVGKGKNGRMNFHIERSKTTKPGTHPFYDKLKKIVSSGYDPIVLEIDKFEDEDLSLEAEKILIEKIGRLSHGRGPLLNLTDGGIGGDTFSGQTEAKKELIRKKISESNKGKNLGKKISEEQKARLREVNLGKKRPEHSQRMKGKKQDQSRIERTREHMLKYHSRKNPNWERKIVQSTVDGKIIKVWNNYRELKDRGFNWNRIKYVCDKVKGYNLAQNFKWSWEDSKC
jgi:hypothetical protein